MARYIALIDGRKGAYGVVVPDLPGCTAMGATVEAAIANAATAVRDWVEVTEEAGKKIPAPRALEAVMRDRSVRSALAEGAVLASVPLVRHTGRPAKANLSIDSGTLEAIDAEAQARGLTRSAFIELLAKEALPQFV